MSVKQKNDTSTNNWYGLDSNKRINHWLPKDDLLKNPSSSTTLMHSTSNNNKCSLKHILINTMEEEEKKDLLLESINATDTKENCINKQGQSLLRLYALIQSIQQKNKNKDDENYTNSIMNNTNHLTMLKMNQKNESLSTTASPLRIILKRQRNTDAARRSRLRKAIKMETLEEKVKSLKTLNQELKVQAAVLETEINHAKVKEEQNRQRIVDLEAQLTIVHQHLIKEN
ncbi:uncharacterized protein BX663DRAFT_501595 [Cokeromyces recurvatus]|uniref:uncharacterized protein n=1 Tax=Cokeromyces recurvatus TaxID=90255 RepID=UPI00221FB075|nr:uncharacterized protein BX663DRAFT_501595 [Cokeromyces recurvatus]KAI7905072.1 hypothetical protein BX663DRAFT_501595 [Cokeromyces recurvatus]